MMTKYEMEQYRKRNGGIMSIDELLNLPCKKQCVKQIKDGATLQDLVEFVVQTKDAEKVVNHIRLTWPRSMSTYLSYVRRELTLMNLPCEEFEVAYESAESVIATMIKTASNDDQKQELNRAQQKLVAFKQMSVVDRQNIQRALKRETYSHNSILDTLIEAMPLFPAYFKELRIKLKEHQRMVLSKNDRLLAKSTDIWTVQAHDMVCQAQGILMYDQANPYDKAVALAFVTGRRMIELFKQGEFESTGDDKRLKFSGQAKQLKTMSSVLETDTKDDGYFIPTLVSAELILKNIKQLREAKNCDGINNRQVNARYCNSCNVASRRFIGRKFHDLRSAYAVVTYHCAQPHKWSQNAWVCTVLGHTNVNGSVTYASANVEDMHTSLKFVWTEAM
jgi:hypothetical protein